MYEAQKLEAEKIIKEAKERQITERIQSRLERKEEVQRELVRVQERAEKATKKLDEEIAELVATGKIKEDEEKWADVSVSKLSLSSSSALYVNGQNFIGGNAGQSIRG